MVSDQLKEVSSELTPIRSLRRRSTPNVVKPTKPNPQTISDIEERSSPVIYLQSPTLAAEASTDPQVISKGDLKDAPVPKISSGIASFFDVGSEILENKGSVARDHMANERTFLSWIRTSLGLATVGVSVTQLFKLVDEKSTKKDDVLKKLGKPIGGSFISIGIFCALMGLVRFFRTQTLLKEDRYPATRISVLILVILIFTISIVILIAILYADTV